MSKNHLGFRKSLPIGFLKQNEEGVGLQYELELKMKELFELAKSEANIEGTLIQLETDFREQFSLKADGHFASLDELDQISLDTVVGKRDDLIIEMKEISTGPCITYSGNIIKGPPKVSAAFEFITKSEGAYEISNIPGIGDKSKLLIVRQFIKDGLLKIVEL